jgi:NADH-quinone oxidoreductase subunit G
VPVPLDGIAGLEPSESARGIAGELLSGARCAVFLGNFAEQHADATQLHALAQALAAITGATLGFLREAANSVGAELAGARPQSDGLNAKAMLAAPRRAYLMLHAEAELDCASPLAARGALERAELVVVMSPFRHGMAYADVLLPIAPFTETSGTFVNCEGRAQSFRGVVKPRGQARPGWKVLRVLGTMLGLAGFDAETSEAIRDAVVAPGSDLTARLDNRTDVPLVAPVAPMAGVERVADVPIYFADPLVRRAGSLQQTKAARPPRARVHRLLLDQLGIAEGAQVRIRQGQGEAVVATVVDPEVPPGVVWLAAAHASTCALEALSGPVTVERA